MGCESVCLRFCWFGGERRKVQVGTGSKFVNQIRDAAKAGRKEDAVVSVKTLKVVCLSKLSDTSHSSISPFSLLPGSILKTPFIMRLSCIPPPIF